MKLVWTYDDTIDIISPENRTLLLNYYIHSIQMAKSFGYYTVIYTNTTSVNYFEKIIDEIIIVDGYENSPLFDSYKFKVLETMKDDYCLIDGDLILHNTLPEMKSDVTFDCYEFGFPFGYSATINTLTEIGISNYIDEWEYVATANFNCGILRILDNEFRQLYVDKWKIYNQFIIDNLVKLKSTPINYLTTVGAQYLLKILCYRYDKSNHPIQNCIIEKGEYYIHYAGDIKYQQPIVPINTLHNVKIKNLI